MLRLLGVLVTVLVTIAVVVVTWPGFFRVEMTFPVAQIVSFRAMVVVAFITLVLVALLLAIAKPLRGFAFSVVAVLVLGIVANSAILISRGLGTDTLPPSTDTSIRVMTWNTAGGATSATAIAQIAVAMEADIVTLPETTIETGERVAVAMRELGRRMWALYADEGAGGAEYLSTTILISPELGDYAMLPQEASPTLPTAVAAPVDGTGPVIVAAHAVAPRPEDMDHWRTDLRWLADQCSGAEVIVAGDFNATIDHLHSLGAGGDVLGHCSDSASATGNGSVGTWSSGLPSLLGAPIDHVMVSEHWRATGSLVLTSAQTSASDHRPLVVQLEPQ